MRSIRDIYDINSDGSINIADVILVAGKLNAFGIKDAIDILESIPVMKFNAL